MRISVVCLAAFALAACGPAQSAPPSSVPSLEPRSERAVRIYQGTTPRCGFRELGSVAGRTIRDVRSRAFQMHANAVILEPHNEIGGGGGYMRGMAVAFTRADCQQ